MIFRPGHLVAALLLHMALIGLLVSGVQCSRKIERPLVIQAVLLDPSRQEAAAEKRREAEEAQRRKAEAEKRRQEEEAAKKRAEEQRQKALAEQQRKAAEALKQKQAAEAKKKAEALKKEKAAADKKKDSVTAKKKQQQDRERQEAVQRDIQNQAQIEDAMRQEAQQRAADQKAAAQAASDRDKQVALWSDKVRRAVTRAWNPPPGAGQFKCNVHVRQFPDGTVEEAKVEGTCGNLPLNKSVEDAVLRASPLPVISDPTLFQREFGFEFVP